MERLEGIVERITFQSPETGYTVARLQPEGRSGESVTVVGGDAVSESRVSVCCAGGWTGRRMHSTGASLRLSLIGRLCLRRWKGCADTSDRG